MLITLLKTKIHAATVTEARLEYEGSIEIDEALLKAGGILPYEKVEVYNITNGERFATYVIKGKENSGTIGLNGAAARKVYPGDSIIIIAYGLYSREEVENYSPCILLVDEKNAIKKRLP